MTIIDKHSSFDKNGHFSDNHVVIHSTNMGCGRLGALICLQYASVCIHMHPPYAPICLHTPYLRLRTQIFNTHFRREIKKVENNRNRLFYNAIRSIKSVQFQSNIANFTNMKIQI